MLAIAVASVAIAMLMVRILVLVRHHAQYEIPGTLGFILYTYLCFHVLMGLPPTSDPIMMTFSPLTRIAGAVLFLMATGMFVWCGRLLREHGKAVARLRNTSQLVMHGPYKYVRHPFYAATSIALIGITVIWPTIFAIGIAAIAFCFLAVGAHIEDKHNLGVFGDRYTAYMARTKLMVPFLI